MRNTILSALAAAFVAAIPPRLSLKRPAPTSARSWWCLIPLARRVGLSRMANFCRSFSTKRYSL